jgi:hypothetical protein
MAWLHRECFPQGSILVKAFLADIMAPRTNFPGGVNNPTRRM